MLSDDAMTNEELAEKIQAGETELIPVLWAQVEQYVKHKANIIAQSTRYVSSFEFSDLCQSGYIGFLDAIKRYEPGRGKKFIGVLTWSLQKEFAEATGYRTNKQKNEPLHGALSLNTTFADDEENTPLINMIPDRRAQAPYEAIAQREEDAQIRATLEQALDGLDEKKKDIMRRRYCDRQTLREVSAALGISVECVRQHEQRALRLLRHPALWRNIYAVRRGKDANGQAERGRQNGSTS